MTTNKRANFRNTRENIFLNRIVIFLLIYPQCMISFYPGPSRVHDQIPAFVQDGYRLGVLSINHRSDEFMALCKTTVSLLHSKLNIPNKYSIFFTSSATECWEIIAQSLIEKESLHLYNGAFGEKWFNYTKRIRPAAQSIQLDCEQEINNQEIKPTKFEVLAITQNETSNGTQVSHPVLASLQKKYSNALIAVDATSSMGGMALDFTLGDIWFASVQKCFGLPAGLAVMVCSPRAIARMKEINECNHYNSLPFIHAMMKKWQTPCTPNVLGIYLLMRVLKSSKKIEAVHKKIEKRAKAWYHFFEEGNKLKLYVNHQPVRSLTVITITGKQELLAQVKQEAKKKGFLLGEGYGPSKSTTLRIANFPALKKTEVRQLQKFLSSYLK